MRGFIKHILYLLHSHLQALVASLPRFLQILQLLGGRVEGRGGVLVCPSCRVLLYDTQALQGLLLVLQELELLLLLLLSLQHPAG